MPDCNQNPAPAAYFRTARVRRPVRWAIRFWMLLKKHLKNPAYYLCLAAAAAFAAMLMRITEPAVGGAYGVYSGGGTAAERIVESMEREAESDSEKTGEQSRMIVYKDESGMRRDLYAGRIDCAFVLPAALDDALDAGKLSGSVEYYSTPSTAQGEVLKEKVYANLFQEYARRKLAGFAGDGRTFRLSARNEAERKEEEGMIVGELAEKYETYRRDPGIFQASFITENGAEAAENRETSAPRRGSAICGILLFSLALIFARVRFASGHRRMMAAFGRREGRMWSVLEVFAPMLPAAVLFGIYMAAAGIAGGWRPAVSAAAGLFLCTLWSTAFATVFRREASYLFCILAVIALAVLTCPAFFDYASLTPALAGLKWIFPIEYIRLLL